ncbi:hypothetical protein [Pseudokineococcus sp. 1T1Z-3]|uniref:hypothetical protein n=1 Tax=Pseudokineococcus sp. 1T1Z-3 TaxID=3132745 RepID=UPI0030B219AF
MEEDRSGARPAPPADHDQSGQRGQEQGADQAPLVCSARGCRAAPAWGLRWNNPRLHTPERRKTWLACDEHRERLSTHLDVRGFLRDVVPAAGLTGGRS